MNSLDRFSQSAAEDGQASKRINWQEATVLTGVEQVITTLESLRTFNTDSDNDAYMIDAIASLRGVIENIEG
jgi:hypothetical protein